jgi:hypothetical protein
MVAYSTDPLCMTIPEARARLMVTGLGCRSVWCGDDGRLRCGRSGDVVTMLDDLRIPSIGGFAPGERPSVSFIPSSRIRR